MLYDVIKINQDVIKQRNTFNLYRVKMKPAIVQLSQQLRQNIQHQTNIKQNTIQKAINNNQSQSQKKVQTQSQQSSLISECKIFKKNLPPKQKPKSFSLHQSFNQTKTSFPNVLPINHHNNVYRKIRQPSYNVEKIENQRLISTSMRYRKDINEGKDINQEKGRVHRMSEHGINRNIKSRKSGQSIMQNQFIYKEPEQILINRQVVYLKTLILSPFQSVSFEISIISSKAILILARMNGKQSNQIIRLLIQGSKAQNIFDEVGDDWHQFGQRVNLIQGINGRKIHIQKAYVKAANYSTYDQTEKSLNTRSDHKQEKKNNEIFLKQKNFIQRNYYSHLNSIKKSANQSLQKERQKTINHDDSNSINNQIKYSKATEFFVKKSLNLVPWHERLVKHKNYLKNANVIQVIGMSQSKQKAQKTSEQKRKQSTRIEQITAKRRELLQKLSKPKQQVKLIQKVENNKRVQPNKTKSNSFIRIKTKVNQLIVQNKKSSKSSLVSDLSGFTANKQDFNKQLAQDISKQSSNKQLINSSVNQQLNNKPKNNKLITRKSTQKLQKVFFKAKSTKKQQTQNGDQFEAYESFVQNKGPIDSKQHEESTVNKKQKKQSKKSPTQIDDYQQDYSQENQMNQQENEITYQENKINNNKKRQNEHSQEQYLQEQENQYLQDQEQQYLNQQQQQYLNQQDQQDLNDKKLQAEENQYLEEEQKYLQDQYVQQQKDESVQYIMDDFQGSTKPKQLKISK